MVPRPGFDPRRLRTLLLILGGLILLPALVAIASASWWSSAPGGLEPGWFVFLLIALVTAFYVGGSYMAIRGREAQRHSLLWMLAISAEHRMPLATSAKAFAGLYGGGFRSRIDRLASLLADGTGLARALRVVPGLVSAETAMMVEIGEENDKLGEALRRSATRQSERSAANREFAAQSLYLGLVLLLGQAIAFFTLYFILPKFEAIFGDFGIPLPPITRFVARCSAILALFAPIAVPLCLAAAIVPLTIPRFSSERLTSWLPEGASRRRSVLILRALAMTAGAGRPIESGLRTLSLGHPSRGIRGRLAAVEADVKGGVDWREALRARGLIRSSEFEALNAASAVGNLPWAMNDLADAAERRASLRRTLFVQALWPVIVGSLGAVVLVMALAFFLPLVELIRRLA